MTKDLGLGQSFLYSSTPMQIMVAQLNRAFIENAFEIADRIQATSSTIPRINRR